MKKLLLKFLFLFFLTPFLNNLNAQTGFINEKPSSLTSLRSENIISENNELRELSGNKNSSVHKDNLEDNFIGLENSKTKTENITEEISLPAGESHLETQEFGARPEIQAEDAADNTSVSCPKFKKMERTVVSSSKKGQISDSGWNEIMQFASCSGVDTVSINQKCTNDIIPGVSLGDEDEIILICVLVQNVPLPNVCIASTEKHIFSITPPSIDLLADKLSQVAKAIPGVSDFKFQITGKISQTKGEECCLPNGAGPPIPYEEYAGSVSIGLSVGFMIPGWEWSIDAEWQGIIKVHAVAAIGPKITISPSATASITGRTYAMNQCPSCVTVAVSAGVGVKVAILAEIGCEVIIFEGTWFEKKASASMYLEGNLATALSAGGKYSWAGCPNPGFSGSVSFGKLTGSILAGTKIWGYKIEYEIQWTIFPGKTINF